MRMDLLAATTTTMDEGVGAWDVLPGLIGAAIGFAGALVAVHIASRKAERREARGRALEHQLERERDLRSVVDEAGRALREMADVLSAYTSAAIDASRHIPRSRPRRADPDVVAFTRAYKQLLDAHVRMSLRVEWTDALHAPVGHALARVQEAWVELAQVDPFTKRDHESLQKLLRATTAASTGWRDLQVVARERFAPTPLPGTRTMAMIVFEVLGAEEGADVSDLVNGLQKPGVRPRRAYRDTNRVIVQDAEVRPGEALMAVELELATVDPDWRDRLRLVVPG